MFAPILQESNSKNDTEAGKGEIINVQSIYFC